MLNKIILIGNVGQDPEIKALPNGHRVANFSLATTEYWKDKNGEKQKRKVLVWAAPATRRRPN